eukprot:778042-Alexandrium_andersonii.AAC.1
MGRTRARPEGQEGRRDVYFANRMAEFVTCLLILASLRGVFWIVEQPGSSLLFELRCFRSAIAKCKASRVYTMLSGYGHDLPKPSLFYGTAPWMSNMYRKASRSVAKQACEYWYRTWSG